MPDVGDAAEAVVGTEALRWEKSAKRSVAAKWDRVRAIGTGGRGAHYVPRAGLIVDVEVQLPTVGVGGQPDVAAFGADRCLRDLRVHGDESMSRRVERQTGLGASVPFPETR